MHDVRRLRADPHGFDAALARRGLAPEAAGLIALDDARRGAQTDLQAAQTARNDLAKRIGQAKRAGTDSAALEAEAIGLRDAMEVLTAAAAAHGDALHDRLGTLPNALDDAVPDGADETANRELSRHGEPREFPFEARQHFELGEALGLMDFETAGRIAGARFTILRGALARMERALGQFMLDLHLAEHGYEETVVPLLVNTASAYGTGNLPKFKDDSFQTTDGRWLIPTAEMPLTNTVGETILAPGALPLRLTALTECFRSEAGSAGRDTRGMLRQHQFRKVELVSIVAPEDSDAEHERMTRCAETVLERLGLPYRRMLLCAGDTGFSAARTHDLEVWLPGQRAWREISSCSNTRDFQARRMNARLRDPVDPKSIRFLHTLNGSGVAVGRALIAVMENYQTQAGGIIVPDALLPYMGGIARIGG